MIGGSDGRAVLLVGDDLQVLPSLAAGQSAGVHLVTNAGDAAGYSLDAEGGLKPARWSC